MNGEHGGTRAVPLAAVLQARRILSRLWSARASRHEPLPGDQGGWEEFQREFDRSRRYERRFVLVRVPCETANGNRPEQHAGGTARERIWQVSAFLRSVDRAWYSDGGVYVLLPECDRAKGEAFLHRIGEQAPGVLPPNGQVGLAAFPEDGWTSGALLAALEGHRLVEGGLTRPADGLSPQSAESV